MRIVIKIGTSTLAHATGRLNIQRMERLCKVLSDLKNAGHEIILVSSGAIGMGVGKLNLPGRPADMPGKQAAAAVGQCELMYFYDKLFTEYNHIVAQLLLTGEDIHSEQRSRNVRNTLSRLLELGRCRSSTKMTPWRRTRSAWRTPSVRTTASRPSWPLPSVRIC